ncbi:MAG: methyl-accepting chemotaxis protein [Deltaproteobacteria bacterium]|nr:methyl-accepting chemotaxis protein [Deltaproteobacteria bacterium]
MKQRNKRRLYPLIARSHQYRFLAIILIYNLIIVIFLAISLFGPDILKLEDETLSLEVRKAAADKILTMHSRIWPAVISLICVIGMHSFRVFQRFIGPVYRFTKVFEQVGNGDLSLRVKLRKKDYLHREEKELNKMIEMLAKKMRSTQLATMGAMKSLSELEQTVTVGRGWSGTDKERLSVLRQHLDTLMDTVQYFRLQKGEEEVDGTVS